MKRTTDSLDDLVAFLKEDPNSINSPNTRPLGASSDQLRISTELPPLFPGLEGLSSIPEFNLPSTIIPLLPVKSEVKIEASEEVDSVDEEEEVVVKNEDKKGKKTPAKSKKRTPANQNNRRPRKKQKVESGFVVALTGMNSEELMEYSSTHALSEAQKADLKSHLRKIKNRESALLSRQRQRSHQDELEIQIHKLEKANTNLEREVVQLEAENKTLKGELQAFQQMISGLAKLYVDQKPSELPSSPITERVPSPSAPGALRQSSEATAIVSKPKPRDDALGTFLQLLIVLHSLAPHFDSTTTARIPAEDVAAMSKIISVKS